MPRKNPHAVALGRKGGKVGGKATSNAKAAAARENGKKGGRPRKALVPDDAWSRVIIGREPLRYVGVSSASTYLGEDTRMTSPRHGTDDPDTP